MRPLACLWRSFSRCTATAGVARSLKLEHSLLVRATLSLFLSFSLSLLLSRRLSLSPCLGIYIYIYIYMPLFRPNFAPRSPRLPPSLLSRLSLSSPWPPRLFSSHLSPQPQLVEALASYTRIYKTVL